jgi:hypothetical protein
MTIQINASQRLLVMAKADRKQSLAYIKALTDVKVGSVAENAQDVIKFEIMGDVPKMHQDFKAKFGIPKVQRLKSGATRYTWDMKKGRSISIFKEPKGSDTPSQVGFHDSKAPE